MPNYFLKFAYLYMKLTRRIFYEILRTEDQDLYPSPKKICDFLAKISQKLGRPLGGEIGSTCGTTKSKPTIVPEIRCELQTCTK